MEVKKKTRRRNLKLESNLSSTKDQDNKASSETVDLIRSTTKIFWVIVFIIVLGIYIIHTSSVPSSEKKTSPVTSETHDATAMPKSTSIPKSTKKKLVSEEKKEKPKAKSSTTIDQDTFTQEDLVIQHDIIRGKSLLDKKKFDEAVRLYKKLAKEFPSSPQARYGKANALLELAYVRKSNDQLKEAIAVFEEVASLPNCPKKAETGCTTRQRKKTQNFCEILKVHCLRTNEFCVKIRTMSKQ